MSQKTAPDFGEKTSSRYLSMMKPNATTTKQLLTTVLTRPIRMFAEPMVFFTDLFLLYQYAILFLYFEAYPIIFKGIASFPTLITQNYTLIHDTKGPMT